MLNIHVQFFMTIFSCFDPTMTATQLEPNADHLVKAKRQIETGLRYMCLLARKYRRKGHVDGIRNAFSATKHSAFWACSLIIIPYPPFSISSLILPLAPRIILCITSLPPANPSVFLILILFTTSAPMSLPLATPAYPSPHPSASSPSSSPTSVPLSEVLCC